MDKESKGILAKLASLITNDSARVKDVNGYMSISECNISKAAVNPYYGNTIPNWQEFGLTPDKIYYMYRDPDELARAASSFNGKPLLNDHNDISANNIPKESVIGSVGTNVYFEYPFLKASLTIWDAQNVALVEHNKKKELSCSYFYTADMTAGEVDGVHYDGIMRNIIGNHVAVVEQGRAGSQVAVADSGINTNQKEVKKMALLETIKKSLGLANDAKDEDVIKAIEAKKADDETEKESEAKKANDEEKKAEDENSGDKDAKYDDRIEKLEKALADKQAELDDYKEKAKGDNDEEAKKANDAAIVASITQQFKDASKAQAAVRPFVGELAMDNASDIYAKGLKHLNVDMTNLPKEAYQATFEAVSKASRAAKANDAAIQTNSSVAKAMNLKHL